jgi:putative Holliday junction resolvase
VIRKIKEVIDKYGDISDIVIGLPISLSGKKGIQAEKVEKFAGTLEASFTMPVRMIDERLSTAESTKKMREAGLDSRKIRGIIDETSAMAILQNYLELHGK